jgi:hypothetical protein
MVKQADMERCLAFGGFIFEIVRSAIFNETFHFLQKARKMLAPLQINSGMQTLIER